jgi:Retrotransposon gag protein/Zinc knuckle
MGVDSPTTIQRLKDQLAERNAAFEASEAARQQAEQKAEKYKDRATAADAQSVQLQGQVDEMAQRLVVAGAPPSSSDGASSSRSSAPRAFAPTFGLRLPAPQPPTGGAPPAGAQIPMVHAVTMDLISIPYFTGESRDVSVEQFLKAFRSFVKINNTPPGLYHAILDGRTEGRANDVVQNMAPNQIVILAEVEKAFRHAFCGRQYLVSLEQKLAHTKQTPHESVDEFYNRVNKIVREVKTASTRHVGISEEAWVVTWENRTFTAFLVGLRQDIYTFVLARNPKTLDQAREAAEIFEETNARGKLYEVEMVRSQSYDNSDFCNVYLAEQSTPPAARRPLSGAGAASFGSAQVAGPSQRRPGTPFRPQGTSSAPSSRGNSPSGSPSPRRNMKYTSCNNCRQEGHWVRDCPYKGCGICGQAGHLPYECEQQPQKN